MVAVVDLGEEDLVGGRMNRGRERGEWEEGSRRRRRGGLIPLLDAGDFSGERSGRPASSPANCVSGDLDPAACYSALRPLAPA